MDILCTTCGERWGIDHVLHDEPEEFEREGARVTRCPACRRGRPRLSTAHRNRLALAEELALLCGDDVDAYAAELEDLDLL